MKLNKTEKSFSGLNNIELYVPIDPKYIYPTENMANGSYTWNNSIYDTNNQPADDGLEHLMLQRQDLIFSKIDMLNSEIYERHQIKEANLYQINLDQCSFKNMIYAMGDHLWDKNRVELERRIVDLEVEQCQRCRNQYILIWLKLGDDYNDFGDRHCPFCGLLTEQFHFPARD